MEVICHNDFSPHNLAFDRGRIVGAIDFDFASPGPRIWDLAYYATRVVPLTGEPPEGAPSGTEMRRRARLVLDSYGMHHELPELIGIAIRRLRDLATFSVQKADELDKPGLRGDAEYYEREAHFLRRTVLDGFWSTR